ncbi:MAG: hypothetical protein ACR5K7_05855 [Symbiopectobacterium sp.]
MTVKLGGGFNVEQRLFDNDKMIDQLEAKIRTKAAMLDKNKRITVNVANMADK